MSGFRADVDALREHGKQDFPSQAELFSSASADIGRLNMDSGTFGEGCAVAGTVTADYGSVQGDLGDATSKLSSTLRDIGKALVKIADNYRAIDDHYGN